MSTRAVSRPLRVFGFGFLLLVAILAATHSLWMTAAARFLIQTDAPCRADAVLVLGGDQYGRRILRGAQLAREGHAPYVLVSGPSGMYGFHESELAIGFAVRHGYPQNLFVAAPHNARSTREEARLLRPYFQQRGIRQYLLVTSDYHTRRSARVFRQELALPFCTVGAIDEHFHANAWWRDRNAAKIVLLEWSKTIADRMGM